jgi:hypothetical protein
MDRELLLFRIRGYTPDTLPLARLADYLKELATLYGSRDSTHFDKLLKGSVVVQAWVPGTESQRVIARVSSVKRSDAPEDAKKAYDRIDTMLRENQASATIRTKRGADILAFPGVRVPIPQPLVVSDLSEVEGQVVRVGGVDKSIPVHLQGGDGVLYPCQVKDRDVARRFAQMLYGAPIRVRGMGQWERAPDGVWKLTSMVIEGWDELEDVPLAETFQRMAAIQGNGWKQVADPDAEVRKMRGGS